ncbi:MAG: hypothetical protein JNN13_14475 [Planctomycetes bacterium]|nr:hypothetical protein [Planctomycetota bacterium]
MLPLALVAALSCAAVQPGPQQPRSFALPTPALFGTFGNLARDRLEFAAGATGVTATGTLGGAATTLTGALHDGAFTGEGKRGEAAATSARAAFTGETLVVTLGDGEWRLAPELALDATLADLGNPEPDAERQWTVAIYLAGDNDLEPAALRDLLEMQRGMPARGCAVVALIDRHADAEDGADEWSDTRVLRVQPGDDGTFTRLGPVVERDTGDPRTLASFVSGVFRKFPAKRHAVILWDHGGAWTGMCVDEDAPGQKPTTQLGLAGIRSGLTTALQTSGVLKLDLLGFDACLMAQLDVALAVHDLADSMVASEANVPGSGFPYDQVLPQFAIDQDGAAVAKAIVRDYGTFSDANSKSGATLAAFDLAAAPAVAAAVDGVALAALTASDQQWRAIARALFFAENYETRENRIADDTFASIDLGDFAARLRGVPGIADDPLTTLDRALASMQLAVYRGNERSLSRGLSIYGPHRAGQYQQAYDRTPLGLGNDWRRLLRRVHQLADADTSPLAIDNVRQLDALGKNSTTARPFGGDRLLLDVTGNSIVQVEAEQWQFDDGLGAWVLLRRELVVDPLWPARWATAAAADMIDLVMPQYVEGKNELFHELGGLSFVVTDGSLQTYASIDLTAPSTQAPLTAVARYTETATGEVRLVQVSFDRAEWNACAFQPIARPGQAPRKVEPVPGDTFEFVLATRDDAGERTPTFTPALTMAAGGLALLAVADDPGRYRVDFTARTLQGRTATTSHDYTVADNADLAAWPASWQDFDPARLAGSWQQFLVTGPQQYRDLHTTCDVAATTAANLFVVTMRGGAPGNEFETHPLWLFEWRSLPCLRIVSRIEDGQKFGWYGPVRVSEQDGKLRLAMKALNASGVVWEWRQR